MIARLVLGESGPKLVRPRDLGPSHRLVVLLSRELSTSAPPRAWPAPTSRSAVLVARLEAHRLYARASLRDTVGAIDASTRHRRHSTMMVPEEALRVRRDRRRSAWRPHAGGLARFAFRDVAARSRRMRLAAFGILLAAALTVGTVALRSHASSSIELQALETERRSLGRARATIAELEIEAKTLRAHADVDPPPSGVVPADLLSRIVATLEDGELVESYRVSGDRLTLVVASGRGLAVARSIDALAGVREVTGALRANEHGTTVTVDARIGAAP